MYEIRSLSSDHIKQVSLVYLSLVQPFNSPKCQVSLIDFTLSNARRFYTSMGNASGVKGLTNNIKKTMSPF